MISPELQDLLEPLERFESTRRKVARLGGRLADLSYANPYGGIQEQAKAILRETLDTDRLLDLQYSPFGGKTLVRRAVADSLRETHNLPFVFSDVVLTPGAMAGLQLALRTAGQPGLSPRLPVGLLAGLSFVRAVARVGSRHGSSDVKNLRTRPGGHRRGDLREDLRHPL